MNRIKSFLSRARERRLPLRDVNSLRKIVNGYKKKRRRKKLIDIIKSYNKCESTKLPNEEILNIKSYIAEEITEQEYKNHGFNNYQDIIQGMKSYYSNFNDKTKVTIVRWDNIKFDAIM